MYDFVGVFVRHCVDLNNRVSSAVMQESTLNIFFCEIITAVWSGSMTNIYYMLSQKHTEIMKMIEDSFVLFVY